MLLGFAGFVLLNDSALIQDLACAIDIISEKLGHIVGKVLPNHNTHYFDIRCIIRQAVCWDYPPFFSSFLQLFFAVQSILKSMLKNPTIWPLGNVCF